jgi:hypothetical protein
VGRYPTTTLLSGIRASATIPPDFSLVRLKASRLTALSVYHPVKGVGPIGREIGVARVETSREIGVEGPRRRVPPEPVYC